MTKQDHFSCHGVVVMWPCVQVRWQALQALCAAPPSDVLSCESWSSLRRNLCAALTDPDLSVSPKNHSLFFTVSNSVIQMHSPSFDK